MGLSDYGAEHMASVLFKLEAAPANFYLALCTDEPGSGWDGTVLQTVEPADSAYDRPAIPLPAGWVVSEQGFVVNATELDFATPTVDWGSITHYAICDDHVAGNIWFFQEFMEGLVVPAGYDASIGPGSLTFALQNQLDSIVVDE